MQLDINTELHPDDAFEGTEYELIEQNKIRYDGEKGFLDYELIIYHKETNKYYRAEYTNYGHGRSEIDNNWTEVFPHTITKTIYETYPQ